jgi:hypothetical protein
MSELVNYYFLPFLRQGLATAITQNATGERAVIDVELKMTAEPALTEEEQPVIPKSVQLYGPGDILGFDARIVTRTDPKNNMGDFEPNHFPAIEFDDPDFLWRYTAKPPDINGNLIPWITLIVLIAEGTDKEFEEGERSNSSEVPWIKNMNPVNLPDLNEAWRWAHVQITADESLATYNPADLSVELKRIINTEPERVVSRLICARRLRPSTLYHAFVVPTFKLGSYAGRKIPPDPNDHALIPAWTPGDGAIDLPYYYKWEFRTGLRGDFEYLVRLLEPRELPGLGIRDMNCENPGFGLQGILTRAGIDSSDPYYHVLLFEGALKSTDTKVTQWGADAITDEEKFVTTNFQTPLASNVLNKHKADQDSPASDPPVVGPPIYGRWHAALKEVVANSNDKAWLHELNLDPRHRTAAGFGTTVIQNQQESLMASAWKQLGAVEEANERLRRAQVGREASVAIESRLKALCLGDYLRATTPLHTKVKIAENSKTVHQQFKESRIPLAAFDPALRRITRKRGALRRHQKLDPKIVSSDMLERLNSGGIVPAGPHPSPDGISGICDITKLLLTRVAEANKPPIFTSYPPTVGQGEFSYYIITEDPDSFGNLSITAEQLPGWMVLTKSGNRTATLTGTPPAPIFPAVSAIHIVKLHVTDFGRPPRTGWQSFMITVSALPGGGTVAPGGGGSVVPGGGTTPGTGGISWEVIGVSQGALSLPASDSEKLFCEENIDCELLDNNEDKATGKAICEALDNILDPGAEVPQPPPPIDLAQIRKELEDALDPCITIPRRVRKQLRLLDVPHQSDPLATIMAAPEFPQPMYEPLRDISQELLLPGIEKITQNTISLLETNGRFVESFMCGLNHEFAAELLWREYPTDQRGSYFRQFWDVSGYIPLENEIDNLLTNCSLDEKNKLIERYKEKFGDISKLSPEKINEMVADILLDEKLKDIKALINWSSRLGENDNRPGKNLVLIIRGDLLKKYPNTVIYAVEAFIDPTDGSKKPKLSEYTQDETSGEIRYPLFSGTLAPDITFLGFDLDKKDAWGCNGSPYPEGWYFVLEQRVSEACFGMDDPSANLQTTLDIWNNLSWSHIPSENKPNEEFIEYDDYIDAKNPPPPITSDGKIWNSSSADIAWITCQWPVRIIIHARQMLPSKGICD